MRITTKRDDDEPIIQEPDYWLWPPTSGPPSNPGGKNPDPEDPTLLYYEPFQGPQLCTQESGRWRIMNYKPDLLETCPALPIDTAYDLQNAPTTNYIYMYYASPFLHWIVQSGGANWEDDEYVDAYMDNLKIVAAAKPFAMFRLWFDAYITMESWEAGSSMILTIKRSAPYKRIHFYLARPSNYPFSLPADTSSHKYVDIQSLSGEDRIFDLRDYWPGDGFNIASIYFRGLLAGGCDLTFELKYLDFYLE